MNVNAKEVSIVILIFTAGIMLGLFWHRPPSRSSAGKNGHNNKMQTARRDVDDNWVFINPLLDCAEIQNITVRDTADLESDINDYIDFQKQKGVDTISVYFRDLNNGPWIGINEEEEFYPASLLKVPLMIAVFKQAMDNPALLKQQYTYDEKSRNTREYYKGLAEIKRGIPYTVDELLSYMAKYSDNNASHILSEVVDLKDLNQSYVDMGAAVPDQPGYVLSVKTYATFFRILFNSTYLSHAFSEKALALLSESSFKDGLVAAIPKKIKVAHKFGERDINDGKKQLHDCGIVYYPGKPYVLCVMTRGKDYNLLSGTISHISKMVYDKIDKE